MHTQMDERKDENYIPSTYFVCRGIIMATLWIWNQFKGNKYCTADAVMTKLNVHCCVMTIHVQNCFNFFEISFTGCLVITKSRAITHALLKS